MMLPICYPEKITWILDLSKHQSPLDSFSKKTQKKIRSSLQKINESNYHFKIEPVDADFLDRFFPLYSQNIQQKNSPIVHNLREKIIENPQHNFPYFSLSFYNGDTLQGGLIFSDRGDFLVAAYRTFPSQIELNLAIGISHLAEYFLNEYALKHQKKFIQRGADRNLFGYHAGIGLATFKLNCGYRPYMMEEERFTKNSYKIFTDFEWDEQSTVLIFESTEFRRPIDEVTLAIGEVDKEVFQNKYAHLMKDFPQIKVIHAQ